MTNSDAAKALWMLQNWEPIGNAYSDRGALELCHEIAISTEADMPIRLGALSEIDRLMGIECETPHEADLESYIADTVG